MFDTLRWLWGRWIKRNPTEIETYTGRMINPRNVQASDLVIRDIAHSLSQLCRYTGHSKHFYSVAEHCVHGARQMAGHGRHRLFFLLHDASEAYLNDLHTPLKWQLSRYLWFERRIQRTAYIRFCERLPTVAEERRIKQMDMGMLRVEAHALLPSQGRHWKLLGSEASRLPIEIECWGCKRAEVEFLNTFHDLKNELCD